MISRVDKHLPEGLSLIGIGYLISLAVVTILFFTFDIEILQYLLVCFFAWTGGFFARALYMYYRERS